MDTSRRIFRGRGGPNDRRLPKYNARRRRRHPQQQDPTTTTTRTTSKYKDDNDDDDDGANESNIDEGVLPVVDGPEDGGQAKGEVDDDVADVLEDSQSENDIGVDVDDACTAANDSNAQPSSDVANADTNTDITKFQMELNHLIRRVRNVQESIQLSQKGIADPNVWQVNVLQAVQNCVHEWRSIAVYFSSFKENGDYQNNYNQNVGGSGGEEEDKELDDDDDDDHVLLVQDGADMEEICPPAMLEEEGGEDVTGPRLSTGRAVFGLVQLALQSGPLQGSQPCYLKRCGGQVARMVLDFLDNIVPGHAQLAQIMGFSDRQMRKLEEWKQSAVKAGAADKPPSKSALKKMHEAAAAARYKDKTGQKGKKKGK